MTGIAPAVTVGLLVRMLREGFEGPPGPWTYFTDSMGGRGVFGTVAAVSAAEASQHGGPAGTTIAAHIHHLVASLVLTTKELRGESVSRDRSHTWSVSTVDDAAWVRMRTDLRRTYEDLLVAVQMRTAWDEDVLGIAIGAIAHMSYHLGAVRQRLTLS